MSEKNATTEVLEKVKAARAAGSLSATSDLGVLADYVANLEAIIREACDESVLARQAFLQGQAHMRERVAKAADRPEFWDASSLRGGGIRALAADPFDHERLSTSTGELRFLTDLKPGMKVRVVEGSGGGMPIPPTSAGEATVRVLYLKQSRYSDYSHEEMVFVVEYGDGWLAEVPARHVQMILPE